MDAWIKKREVVDSARRIRSKKPREQKYRKLYARSLENKRVEWDGEINIKIYGIWHKQAMVDSAREGCGSVKGGGGGEPKVCAVE